MKKTKDSKVVETPLATESERGLACIAVNYPNEYVTAISDHSFDSRDIADAVSKAMVDAVINQVTKRASVDIRIIFERTREKVPSVEFHQVSDIATLGVIPSIIKDLIEIVRSASKRRSLLMLCDQVQRDASDPSLETNKLISRVAMEVDTLSRQLSPVRASDKNTQLKDALTRYEQGDSGVRISTGYKAIDNMTPLRPGDMLVVGGETKSGKTMLALNIVANILKHLNETNQSNNKAADVA